MTRNEDVSCCAPEQHVIEGDGLPNSIVRADKRSYCIFGKDAGDILLTDGGEDYLAGGASHDKLKSIGNYDVLVGGDGDDILELPFGSGRVYGGPGNDIIEDTIAATVYGNAGNDFIETDFHDHRVIPGPGRDAVYGGVGTDTVVIQDECEIEQFEILSGGLGQDTLVTPITVAQLLLRGVSVSGFENVVVTQTERHLSECF